MLSCSLRNWFYGGKDGGLRQVPLVASPVTTAGGIATISEIQLLTWADVELQQQGTRGIAVTMGQVHAHVSVTATMRALNNPSLSETNVWVVPVY